jgi:RHS repeat-associated protein
LFGDVSLSGTPATPTDFIWKLNSSGSTDWAIQSDESDETTTSLVGVAVDGAGDVYSAGAFSGSLVLTGVTLTPAGGFAWRGDQLTSQAETFYDNLGQVYQTETDSVDPDTGAVGGSLITNYYYDADGNQIEEIQPNGPVVKDTYDGLGDVTAEYDTDGGSGTAYADASSVSGDVVLTQTEFKYDADQNLIETITSDRLSSDSATTGPLSDGTVTGVGADISYVGNYYDDADRLTSTVNVGNNGGSSWTTSDSTPSTAQVTTYGYDSAGNVEDVTDPNGIDTRTYYDNLGRPTQVIQDYSTSSEHLNTTTDYTYNSVGMTSMTSVQPGGTNQTTQWDYGVSSADGSAIYSNDIVADVEYPNPTTGTPDSSLEDKYTVDAQGNILTYTDRNGTTHQYSYDSLGRLTADTVTTFGSGVDDTINKITYAYNDQGNLYLTTSYATDGGAVVNQVLDLYNAFGQLTQEFQSASGPVNSDTPSVQYTYSNPSTANDSRLTGIVYPDGYTVGYNYASGVDSAVSRVSSLYDGGGTLQSYTYQGLGTVVGTSESGPGVTETTSLDQFGRVASMTWTNSSSTTLAEYSYTYDDDDNVLSRTDGVNGSLSQTYSYGNLNELTGYKEGTISGGTISSPTASQSIDYDALGNVTSNTINGGTAQTRSANAQNEYTSISSATTPTYDNNGNMTTDSTGQKYIYDAWNRLVKVENSAGTSTLETFAYDGLGRRIVADVGGTTTVLFYSAAGQVLEESSGGEYTNRYVWSPVYVNALVLRDSIVEVGPALRLWVIQDANWNVVALVNASGSVVERFDYTPFGSVTALNPVGGAYTGTNYNWAYLWQGGRLDSVTGNYRFGLRDYSPVLMRWTTNDPIGLWGGDPDTYRAEGNDVTNAVDPNGLDWFLTRVDLPQLYQQGATALICSDAGFAETYPFVKPESTYHGATSTADVLGKIEEYAESSIDVLFLSGHGSGGAGMRFKNEEKLDENMSQETADRISKRIKKDGTLVILSCGGGNDKEKMQILANKLRRRVVAAKGFCDYYRGLRKHYALAESGWEVVNPTNVDPNDLRQHDQNKTIEEFKKQKSAENPFQYRERGLPLGDR